MSYDCLVVGSGVVGCTFAERLANSYNKKVLIIEKNKDLGGLCSSGTDFSTGIDYHKFGTHVFYTNSIVRWKYLNKFTDFDHIKLKNLTLYRDQLFPVPINLNTINKFYHTKYSPSDAQIFIGGITKHHKLIKYSNIEEYALSEFGIDLYYCLIKGFLEKIWGGKMQQISPENLANKYKIRYSNNNNFFYGYKYQGIPKNGYTELFKNMLDSPKIDIITDFNFFDLKKNNLREFNKIIFTGAIDEFFNFEYGRLKRDYVKIEKKILSLTSLYKSPVVNFPEDIFPYARIYEPKFLQPQKYRHLNSTLVLYEYHNKRQSDYSFSTIIKNSRNHKKLNNYYLNSNKLKNYLFLGRESTPFLNMDNSIKAAFYALSNKCL